MDMNNEQNIVIIGMPGSGKTTFGRRLAQCLDREFVDVDGYIEGMEGRTIAELFAVSEDCFRQAEIRASEKLAARKGIVVATGGGVVKRSENIDLLKQSGILIFLDRSPDDIVTDVDVSKRPLLAAGPQKVYELYRERIALYRHAGDYRIVNKGAVEDVLQALTLLAQKILQR